jgi:hypothetical protein
MIIATPPGPYPFVHHFLVVDALELARALLDGAVDVVFRHRLRFGCVDRRAKSSIAIGIAAALLGGHRDFTNQLREQRATLRVSRGLVMLDLLPLTMTSHRPEIYEDAA